MLLAADAFRRRRLTPAIPSSAPKPMRRGSLIRCKSGTRVDRSPLNSTELEKESEMIIAKRVGFFGMLALALGIGAACNLYETGKANKLVDAANVSIKAANDSTVKGTGKLAEME